MNGAEVVFSGFYMLLFFLVMVPMVWGAYLEVKPWDPDSAIPKRLNLLKKRECLRNAIVIGFEARGCMASEHQFRYIGKVIGYEQTRFAGEAVVIQVLKKEAGDYRDCEQGTTLEPISNPCLQMLGPRLFMVVR